jgi:alkylated DNA repair dioxygenase AlkB
MESQTEPQPQPKSESESKSKPVPLQTPSNDPPGLVPVKLTKEEKLLRRKLRKEERDKTRVIKPPKPKMTKEEKMLKRKKQKERNEQRKQTYKEDPSDLIKVCHDFMKGACLREKCRYLHDIHLCKRYWKNGGSCKFKHNCRKNHYVTIATTISKASTLPHTDSVGKGSFGTEKREDRQYTLPYARTGLDTNRVGKGTLPHARTGSDTDRVGKGTPKNKVGYRRGDELEEHMTDMRIVVETSSERFSKEYITSKDVILAPNVFGKELMEDLKKEIDQCGISKEQLFKLWHSNCHYIADDKLLWKNKVPTFNKIIEKMAQFFNVKVEATRLNIYKENDFKYWHHDQASFNPRTAQKQNFTICLNLGTTRTVGFRLEKSRTIVTMPIQDGEIYCFSKQVNIDWEHGVYKRTKTPDHQDDQTDIKQDPLRMSIVIWGLIENMDPN